MKGHEPARLVRVTDREFSPWQETAKFEIDLTARQVGFGATAVFVGTMRDFNDDASVTEMTLEHYPGMTEHQLRKILAEALHKHQAIDGLIVHRVGVIRPWETIVLVAIWSAHRGSAFAACRDCIEILKTSAPFWKKERRHDGERWVVHNTPG